MEVYCSVSVDEADVLGCSMESFIFIMAELNQQ